MAQGTERKNSMKEELDELIESYINGNKSYVRQQLAENDILLSELLEHYIIIAQPDVEGVVRFVRSLEAQQ